MRSSIASCLTFTTVRRSADLTFAIGSRGRDVDPDVEIVCRRAIALRRSMAKDEKNKKMIQELYEAYRQCDEPGIYKNQDDLKERTL